MLAALPTLVGSGQYRCAATLHIFLGITPQNAKLFLLFGMGLFSGRWFDQGYFKIEFFVGTILILLS